MKYKGKAPEKPLEHKTQRNWPIRRQTVIGLLQLFCLGDFSRCGSARVGRLKSPLEVKGLNFLLEVFIGCSI